ncbi:MAG TPA: carboxypeptidase regulatory-like domain-containing protein [Gammaproteobacteria bacterium]|nr:carboxypeptidase regulatory-like domain-containing protein [Gammaproteobacteria bacterium]
MAIRTAFHSSAFRSFAAIAVAAWLAATPAHSQQTVALSGRVTSAREPAMEGVLVSAKREGSSKTVTVVSRADGRYAFPSDRLEPGRYAVSVRAVKYLLADRDRHVDIAAGKPAQLDLELRDANPLELALQLTDPEWLASWPLDDRTKWDLFRDCSRCHTLRRPSMSTYDAEELPWVMMRMVYSAGSTPMRYQLPASGVPHWGRADGGVPSALQKRQAEAVASINLHAGTWSYELKTMPRPKGKETEVVYTTWDLPATSRPHDTRIAADGAIWFNHFNDNAIGRLDPKTGEVKEWRWPYRAAEGSFQPTGARTLMGPDAQGRWYIGNQAQGGVVVFDPKTEQFEFHMPPGGGEMIDVSGARVDGKAWRASAAPVAGGAVYQIDLETWQHQQIKGTAEKPLYAYDIAADSHNNVYGSARGAPYVWRVNAKTHEVQYFDIPAEPRGAGSFGTGMRRGIVDSKDRLWWGGFDGGFIGMLDPSKPSGQQMKLYAVPFPYFFPYDAHYDEQGYTWTGGIYADRVARLNVDTGEWNFYLLPFEANIRDINLRPAARGGLSGLWLGHTHEAKITLVEPLAR